jgi:hypothetical protein
MKLPLRRCYRHGRDRGRDRGRGGSNSGPTSTTTTNSQQLRNGIVTSLQPLRQTFPHIIVAPTSNNNMDDNMPPSFRPYNNNNNLLYASISPAVTAATAAVSAVTEPVTTAVATHTGVSFWRFLVIFTMGGLFFSTVLAVAAAFYTMGMDNMKLFTQIGLLVVSKIWKSFVTALSLARRTLLGIEEEEEGFETDVVEDTDGKILNATKAINATAAADVAEPAPKPVPGKSDLILKQQQEPAKKPRLKWRDAWAVLKEQLGETGRTAKEGVQALRQEATLYAAAVGQPGLLPVQYVIQKLLPYSLSTILEDSLKDALRNVEPTKTIKKMKLTRFTAGNRSPVLQGARLYDIDNAMAFDLDAKWESAMEADIQIYTVGGIKLLPVSIKQLKFEGVIRVILTPLTKQPPGYGAMLLSLPSPPDLSLDVKVLGTELTKVRFLKTEITQMMQKAVSDNLLWPKRNVIPTKSEGAVSSGPFGSNDGFGPILNRQQLMVLEGTDPLLDIEQKLANSDQALVRDVNEKRKQLTSAGDRIMQISVQDDDDDTETNSIKNAVDAASNKSHNIGGTPTKRVDIEDVISGATVDTRATANQNNSNGVADVEIKVGTENDKSPWWKQPIRSLLKRG